METIGQLNNVTATTGNRNTHTHTHTVSGGAECSPSIVTRHETELERLMAVADEHQLLTAAGEPLCLASRHIVSTFHHTTLVSV